MTGFATTEDRPRADSPLDLPAQRVPAPPPTDRAGYVQVPYRELLVDVVAGRLHPLDVTGWAALASPIDGVVRRSRETLLADLGRRRNQDVGAVSAMTGRLAAAGWLDVTRTHRDGKTRNAYRVLRGPAPGDRRPYVELPRRALDAVRVGTIGPEVLLTLLAYLDAAGSKGWTSDTVATIAGCLGVTTRTVARHRRALLAAGLLDELVRAGHVPLTGRPRSLPTRLRPAPVEAADPRHRTADGADTGPPTGPTQDRRVVPPERETSRERDLPVVPSRRELTTATRASSPPPPASEDKSSTRSRTERPTGSGRRLHPDATQLLAVLPAFRGSPYRWPLLRLLSAALDDGYGPLAIVRTADDVLGDEPTSRHVPDLRRCLGVLRANVLGGACRSCARDPGEVFEVCSTCHPGELDNVDPVELAAVRAALGRTSQVAPDGAGYAASA